MLDTSKDDDGTMAAEDIKWLMAIDALKAFVTAALGIRSKMLKMNGC